MTQEIPVYLFTGFLDAGKTKFIQETLEDVRFNNGESTLLLLCEEGEEEYDPSTFSGKNVFIETIEEQEELTPSNLERLQKKARGGACRDRVQWHVDARHSVSEHAR